MGNVNATMSAIVTTQNSGISFAKYNKNINGGISRVFFKINSFSIIKGIGYLKQITKKNLNTKLIITGGGFFQIQLPQKFCESNYLDNEVKLDILKKYVEKHLGKISLKIATRKVDVPLFIGIDFIDSYNNRTPVQLAVLFTKRKFHIFSKRYPVTGEKVIKPWFNSGETVFIKSIGLVLPLICNDGILWGGRSEKVLNKTSQRSKLSRKLKKRFTSYEPNIVIDFIHQINSAESGKIFASSIKNYNRNNNGSLLGCFGSQNTKFLKKLATDQKIPSKINNLSGELIKSGYVTDFYLY